MSLQTQKEAKQILDGYAKIDRRIKRIAKLMSDETPAAKLRLVTYLCEELMHDETPSAKAQFARLVADLGKALMN